MKYIIGLIFAIVLWFKFTWFPEEQIKKQGK